MRAFLALATLIALSACAPKTEAPPAPQAVQLDCYLPFEALKAKIGAQPGLKAAPPEPGTPYRFYSTADGQASYMITEPGAPGHPAILMQAVANGGERNTGCAYGNKKGYDQIAAYFASLKAGRK